MSLLAGSGCRDGRTHWGARRSSGDRTRRWLLPLVAAAGLVLGLSPASRAQEGLLPGEAFVTQFSGTTTVDGRTVIDLAGQAGVALDLRAPGFVADGRHWLAEPQPFGVTAADVGQVFGVALDDADPPNLYLTATSSFGLHRSADNSGWQDGMWGPGGGPGTIYRLNAADGYRPEIFAEVTLDGRANTGAGLGNIAFDPWHRQFFVSDLETGMIHRIALADGADLGRFDHGITGRGSFTDAVSGAAQSLPPVAFDPATSARIADCPSGDFARTPSCWNFADFRRRVWGLAARRDAGSGEVRLYYAVSGSQAFGNPDWAAAGEDQQNSVWSVSIAEDGGFDASSVRREFFLPEFFRSPEAIARAGISNPVADIAFPAIGPQDAMLLAERGGVRNLGLSAEDAFAYPHEARVLRYERDAQGIWQPAGRYDVGFYDRSNEGPPYIRAGAAGGVALGPGYGASGEIDPAKPDGFVWMTGDALCSPEGSCLDAPTGDHSDTSQVSGLQGEEQSAYQEIIPEAAFQPYPAAGPATPATGPDQSYMIDADVNVDDTGSPIPEELSRNDATRIGDVAVFQKAPPKILDLAITKRSLDPSCGAGGNCPFKVTVSNVGEVSYTGPLVVRDLPENGSTLAIPPASEWSCANPFPSVYECTLAAVTLAPGDSTSFQATFTVPDWWHASVFSNCVELTTPGAGADTRTYNNSACGYAPTAAPGTTYYAPDLRLRKYGLDGQCDWFDNCPFVVRVTNVGAASYTGPIHVHDQIDFPASGLGTYAPAPAWLCDPVGGIDFDCTHPPVTLAPGEFVDLTLWVAAGPLGPGHTTVGNCAWIDWDGGPGDYNPANEYDCAAISRYPPGHPGAIAALDIDKDAQSTCWPGAGPAGGWLCLFRVTVTNVGGAPYVGPIEVSDTADLGAPSVLSDVNPVPWTCAPGIGTPGTRTCSRPGVPGGLQPGESTYLYLDFEAPAAVPVPNAVINCAKVSSDHDGDGIAEDYTSCAYALVCHAGSPDCWRDLAIRKDEQPDPCFPGFPCAFSIVVDNISDQDYPGPLVVTDIPDPGVGPLTVTWPMDVTCVPAGPDYTCTWPHDLLAGNSLWIDLEFGIPPGHPGPSFTNCASVPPGVANQVPVNDQDCATAFVPFPDLAPFGGTTCQRGSDCTLDVRVDNKGLLPFVGSAGLNGTLSPPVEITSIASQTPGFACSVTGSGTYQCMGPHLDIKPGDAAKLQVVIAIPADFPSDTITHTKEMVWPDRAVKDKRPENDRHVSTITIEGPKAQPPPPPPPPPPAQAADLAIDKTANQARCIAGQACGFTITVTNAGAGAYVGPIRIDDVTTPANTRLTGSGPSPWSCRGGNGHYTCAYPATTLAPGAAKTLSLTFTSSRSVTGSIGNCGELAWSDTARVMAVQNALNQLGFKLGTADGKIGPQTKAAIEAYQASAGLPATGRVDDTLLRRMFGSWGVGDANSGNDRACATAAVAPPPPPAITCTGGTFSNNQCVCPSGTVRQQTGTNAYRCVPTITCRGGTVENNECVCPRGTNVEQTGTNAYRCVPTIVCRGGTVKNNECICPKGTEVQQTGTNAYRCVPITPQITCSGGTVKNNQCVCPKGTNVEQTGTNAYRCVPTIVCRGGTVKNNECICPKGTEVQQTGTNAYRCVPITPQITCSGGTVKNNQCVCPKGTNVEQTGTNAYRCVPTIVCRGGTVKNNECVCPKGTNVEQTGTNAYRCVPTIVCRGGAVKNNECVCPKGTNVEQTGSNAYRCVPTIVCRGGTVKNNECVCPKGTEAKPTGTNAYLCVDIQPQPTCEGGRVKNGQCVCPKGSTSQQTGTNAFRCVAIQIIVPRQLIVPAVPLKTPPPQ